MMKPYERLARAAELLALADALADALANGPGTAEDVAAVTSLSALAQAHATLAHAEMIGKARG